MNPKRKKFADAFLETGNATEAARRAGYSPKTAESKGCQLRKVKEVADYIKKRQEEQFAAGVASADEVLHFLSSVVRGEQKDQFGLDASLADRIKAADSLMKRFAATNDKNRASLERLDNILRDFKDAVDKEG